MAYNKFQRFEPPLATSDGLIMLGAKINKQAKLAKVYITDLESNARILVDMEQNKILQGEVRIDEPTVLKLCKLLRTEKPSFMDKLKEAIATTL